MDERERRDFLATVESDLRFLEDEWSPTVDEQSLRRTSNVLRYLLVTDGGALFRAWRLAGQKGEPEVEAIDLAHVLAGLRTDDVVLATAGGGESGGMYVAGALAYRGAMSEATIKERASRQGPPVRRYRLSEFLAAPSIVVGESRVKRRDVIKYVANKLGGAHFDARRKADEEAFRLLDQARDLGVVADRQVVYFELLSIGQTVARSEDARKLRALIS